MPSTIKHLTLDAYIKAHGIGKATLPDDIYMVILDNPTKVAQFTARYKVFLEALELYNKLKDKENDPLVWEENPCEYCGPEDFMYLSYINQYKCTECKRGCVI